MHSIHRLLITLSLWNLFSNILSSRNLISHDLFWKVWILMYLNSWNFIDRFLPLSLNILNFLVQIGSDFYKWFIQHALFRIPDLLFLLVLELEIDIVQLSSLVLNMDDEEIHSLRVWVICDLQLRVSRLRFWIVLLCNEMQESLESLQI